MHFMYPSFHHWFLNWFCFDVPFFWHSYICPDMAFVSVFTSGHVLIWSVQDSGSSMKQNVLSDSIENLLLHTQSLSCIAVPQSKNRHKRSRWDDLEGCSGFCLVIISSVDLLYQSLLFINILVWESQLLGFIIFKKYSIHIKEKKL